MPDSLHFLPEQLRRNVRLALTGSIGSALCVGVILLPAPHRPGLALVAALFGLSELFGARAAWLTLDALRQLEPTRSTMTLKLIAMWNVAVGVGLLVLAAWHLVG